MNMTFARLIPCWLVWQCMTVANGMPQYAIPNQGLPGRAAVFLHDEFDASRPHPTPVTSEPTKAPVKTPTAKPVSPPTKVPTVAPVQAPTKAPVAVPTKAPVAAPTKAPVTPPTKAPTKAPSKSPSSAPTKSPSSAPTKSPSSTPSLSPVAPPPPPPTPSKPKPIPKVTFLQFLKWLFFWGMMAFGAYQCYVHRATIVFLVGRCCDQCKYHGLLCWNTMKAMVRERSFRPSRGSGGGAAGGETQQQATLNEILFEEDGGSTDGNANELSERLLGDS